MITDAPQVDSPADQVDSPADDEELTPEGMPVTFADRLHLLMTTTRTPAWTVAELARATGLTEAGIRFLLRGVRKNPKKSTVEAFCRAFDVPMDYFDDTPRGRQIARDIRWAGFQAALQRDTLAATVLPMAELSDDDLALLQGIIARMRSAQPDPRTSATDKSEADEPGEH
jgi:transcriptional regulator with XRE-family HTH domain